MQVPVCASAQGLTLSFPCFFLQHERASFCQMSAASKQHHAFVPTTLLRQHTGHTVLTCPHPQHYWLSSDTCRWLCSPFDSEQVKSLLVQTAQGSSLTRKGFLSRWAYLACVQPRTALEHMMYLGLHMDPSSMQRYFDISKPRQQERRRGKDFQGRGVFQVRPEQCPALHYA